MWRNYVTELQVCMEFMYYIVIIYLQMQIVHTGISVTVIRTEQVKHSDYKTIVGNIADLLPD